MLRAVRRLLLALFLVLLLSASCNKHALVDVVMSGAHRAAPTDGIDVSPYVLLAGDLHCHVSPPDNPSHVGRALPATIELAEDEGLDFVVLSPHLWDGFVADPDLRREALAEMGELVRSVDAARTDVMLVPGFEYSTHQGHATLAFADLEQVLAEVPPSIGAAQPALFFDRWVAAGGVIVVNHPLLTPLDSVIPNARWDLSWRPWTSDVTPPPDVAAIDRLAHGWEAENSAVSHLRDEWMTGLPDSSRRSVLRQLDRLIPKQQRRMTPIGGSDSHSHHLRAVTFVLAEDRSVPAVRDAIVEGRVCIRDPRACTFEARVPGGDWAPIGASLPAGGEVEVRARGRRITVVRNGMPVATPASGRAHRVRVPDSECSVLRAEVDGGDSAPIYVNCPFAS